MSMTLLPGRSPTMESRSVRHAARGPTVLPILLQLVLVLAVVYAYQIETQAFFHVMWLGVAGFAIHALLPQPHRLRFFEDAYVNVTDVHTMNNAGGSDILGLREEVPRGDRIDFAANGLDAGSLTGGSGWRL